MGGPLQYIHRILDENRPDGFIRNSVTKHSMILPDFVYEIGLLYEYAGRVYSKCQSTTNRPGVIADFNFIVIHLFDPHLHCVPSLHVDGLCLHVIHDRFFNRKVCG